MSKDDFLAFSAPLEEYQQQADALLGALKSGDDAQAVVAHEHGFESWADLAAFTDAVSHPGPVARFEAAVEAVISGNVATLRSMVREHPELIRAVSTRRHHATLLHYVAANGVEDGRQKTPENAVEVAKVLLDAGAEVDALGDMYGAQCTTMEMLVSSCHPSEAGVQGALAETLLDYGAAFERPGSNRRPALIIALAFGYLDTAETLARRGAPVDSLAAVAGLGRLDDSARLLQVSDPQSRHVALALAAQHGHTEVVRLLLDSDEEPSRYNPEGFHSHSTPLHQAVWSNHLDVVKLLVERGARLDIQDTLHQGTPLDWADYGERTAVADYLRALG